jgi:hypothetical protein
MLKIKLPEWVPKVDFSRYNGAGFIALELIPRMLQLH